MTSTPAFIMNGSFTVSTRFDHTIDSHKCKNCHVDLHVYKHLCRLCEDKLGITLFRHKYRGDFIYTPHENLNDYIREISVDPDHQSLGWPYITGTISTPTVVNTYTTASTITNSQLVYDNWYNTWTSSTDCTSTQDVTSDVTQDS